MYILNKLVWIFLNPVSVTLLVAVLGLVALRRRPRVGYVLVCGALCLLWFCSTMTCMCALGIPLERPYVAAQKVESLPCADAIVLLGGGIGKNETMEYPDMYEGADRVWHAARLWKAGKAPVIVASGVNDLAAAVPLLVDLGVPRDAIVVDNESRNTYENSRFAERLLLGMPGPERPKAERKSILLVTSAWHMPRARGNFAKTSLAVVPAPCDFVVHNSFAGPHNWWDWVVPSADAFARTSFLFKEWLGRLARR